MTDEQIIQLFPVHHIPPKTDRRIARQVLAQVRALASGYVDPGTREIVIVPAKSDPNYTKWIAEGSPSCECDWLSDYEVWPASQRDDYIGD